MMNRLAVVFAMEIDGKPTIAFEAKSYREAWELCKEEWLRSDLIVLTSNGVPLCSAAAKLKVRKATEIEAQIYRDAGRAAKASSDLVLAYLVELDRPRRSDEEAADPGPFPPRRP